MDILPIWSLSLSPPLSSLGWTWFSGGPGLSPQLQSQDLPPYKYQQACSEDIGFRQFSWRTGEVLFIIQQQIDYLQGIKSASPEA